MEAKSEMTRDEERREQDGKDSVVVVVDDDFIAKKKKVKRCRAIRLNATNGTTELVVDHEVPSVPEGPDVLIKVCACAISLHDVSLFDEDVSVSAKRTKRIMSTKENVVPGYRISGVAIAVGSRVRDVKAGDEVVAMIPIDSDKGGLSEYTVQPYYNVHVKSALVSHELAAIALLPALRAYDAMHFRLSQPKLMNLSRSVVFVSDGASTSNHLVLQLAHARGARVITTISSDEAMAYIKSLGLGDRLEVVDARESDFRSKFMALTQGLGVDIIVESFEQSRGNTAAVNRYALDVDSTISLLKVGGLWLTSRRGLKLSSRRLEAMWLKNASIGFLFEDAWLLSPTQQGHFRHIMRAVAKDLQAGVLRPRQPSMSVTLSRASEAFDEARRECVEAKKGPIVVVKMKG